jgi:hypothetical protein
VNRRAKRSGGYASKAQETPELLSLLFKEFVVVVRES